MTSKQDWHEWHDNGMAHCLATGEIHVWHIHLDKGCPPLDDCLNNLDAIESARADRFRQIEDCQRFAAGRFVLKRIVADLADRDPSEVAIALQPGGRPFLPQFPALDFNLSHSGKYVLLALRRRPAGCGTYLPVGVDVELKRPLENPLGLASRILPAAAVKRLKATPAIELFDAFYREWVHHEAAVKALGIGLAGERTPAVETTLAGLTPFELPLEPGYAAALAGLTAAERPKLWRYLWSPQVQTDGTGVTLSENSGDTRSQSCANG